MTGTWVALTNQPSFNANHMMLLTDGTVLVQELATAHWWRLSPDASGSYVNGSWSALAAGPNSPTYYASAIMRDGRVFTAGGEYNGGAQVDLEAAQIYDPVANTWTVIGTPGWGWIGDAPACTLADGRIIMGSINDTRTAIYDPTTNSWTAGPNKHDSSSEETWTLLPDGTVLSAEVTASPAAEKYDPATNTWVSAGTLPAGHALELQTAASIEIGPAILMPNGQAFCMGASGHNAIYTPPASPGLPGSWAAAPDFPADSSGNPQRAFDAPAVLLPNGNVLCIAGPAEASGWAGHPANAFEFDGAAFLTAPTPPNATAKDTWEIRLLLLPTGEVLCSARSNDVRVYQPSGSANPAWAPTPISPPASIHPGQTFTLQGTQLNGLSQANSYGDDAQMATNYPIVRIKASNGNVYYCRTSNFSTMGVATGATLLSTSVAVPSSVPLGAGEMCVIANGIAACTPVTVTNKLLKWEIKEIKEKDVKFEKIEVKEHKDIKFEKIEIKELKIEKFEVKEAIQEGLKVIGDNIGKIADGVDIGQQGQIGTMHLGGAQPAPPGIPGPSGQRPFSGSEERPAVGETTIEAAQKKTS